MDRELAPARAGRGAPAGEPDAASRAPPPERRRPEVERAPPDALPPLVLRVGVTGARAIPPERAETLMRGAASVLRAVQGTVASLVEGGRLREVYAMPDGAGSAVLRLVSPLAEGADRLVAEVALGLGYECHAPLPFARADYEDDAPDTAAAFRGLADRSDVIELDGSTADRTAAYRAVGRYVVRNCDILVAVWDGLAERGPGGTAEVVRFAAEAALPVWWIDANGANPPRMILEARHCAHPADAPVGAAAEAALSSCLRTIVAPTSAGRPVRTGLLGRLTDGLCGAFGERPPPLQTYLSEPEPTGRGFSRAYDIFLGVVGTRRIGRPDPPPAADEGETVWLAHFRRADRLSVAYGDKYRSSYVLIAAMAFAGVIFSVLHPLSAAGASRLFVAAEFLLLLCIASIVMANHWLGWQERWITYRLLAELCRKQAMLAPLGRSLPSAEIRQVAVETPGDADGETARGAWASWYFEALRRAAPPAGSDLSHAKERAFKAGRRLIAEQVGYHRARRAGAERSDGRLGEMGEAFFIAIVLSVVGRLALLPGTELSEGIENLATVFSAATAAFVGLRAYSEFALMARQSSRMIHMLNEADRELDLVDLEAPLSSEALGDALFRLSMSMLREVQGWAELFRVKAIETG